MPEHGKERATHSPPSNPESRPVDSSGRICGPKETSTALNFTIWELWRIQENVVCRTSPQGC